jgi:hypothetical protein
MDKDMHLGHRHAACTWTYRMDMDMDMDMTVKILSAFQRLPERVFTLITSLLKSSKSSLYWPFVRTSLIRTYF